MQWCGRAGGGDGGVGGEAELQCTHPPTIGHMLEQAAQRQGEPFLKKKGGKILHKIYCYKKQLTVFKIF